MNEVLAAEKPEDEELVDVLTAISVISMRLARKIVMLASQSQIKEPRSGTAERGSVSVTATSVSILCVRSA